MSFPLQSCRTSIFWRWKSYVNCNQFYNMEKSLPKIFGAILYLTLRISWSKVWELLTCIESFPFYPYLANRGNWDFCYINYSKAPFTKLIKVFTVTVKDSDWNVTGSAHHWVFPFDSNNVGCSSCQRFKLLMLIFVQHDSVI